jgi:hypothetical protein
MNQYAEYGLTALLCGIVSARWALELNYGKGRQLVCFLGGVLFGPLMPLIIYLRLSGPNTSHQFGGRNETNP